MAQVRQRLERDADYCDTQAESRNDHDYVGAHRILAALLYKEVGREAATRIMAKIRRRGGLDGMVLNYDGKFDAYKKLGITEPWQDWALPVE